MATVRKVKDIIEPIYVTEGAGVLLRRSLGTQRLNYLDPFLLFLITLDQKSTGLPEVFYASPSGH